MDYSKLCRICLRQDGKRKPALESLVPIFEPQTLGVKDVWLIFAEILAIFENELVNQICAECFNEIQRTYLFVKKCEKSITYLKEISYKKEDAEPNQIEKDIPKNDVDVESEILWSIIIAPTNDEVMNEIDYGSMVRSTNANKEQHTNVLCDKDSYSITNRVPQTFAEVDTFSEENKVNEILKNDQNSTPNHRELIELIEFEESREILKCTDVIVPSGGKGFQCSFCLEIFTNKDNLYDHMKIHSDEFPLNCEICLTKFRSKEYLEVHLLCHSKTLKCHGCRKIFRYEISRNFHMHKKHPELQRSMKGEQQVKMKRSKTRKKNLKNLQVPVQGNCEKEVEKMATTNDVNDQFDDSPKSSDNDLKLNESSALLSSSIISTEGIIQIKRQRGRPRKSRSKSISPVESNCDKEMEKVPTTNDAIDQFGKLLVASKAASDKSDDRTELQANDLDVNMKRKHVYAAVIKDDNVEPKIEKIKAATSAISNHKSNSCNTISDDSPKSSDNDLKFSNVQSNESPAPSKNSIISTERIIQSKESCGLPQESRCNSSSPVKSNCDKELEKVTRTNDAIDQFDKLLVASKAASDKSDDRTELQANGLDVNMKRKHVDAAVIEDDNVEPKIEKIKAATSAISNHKSNSCNTISDDSPKSSDNDQKFSNVQSNESPAPSKNSIISTEGVIQTKRPRGRPRKSTRDSIYSVEMRRLTITQIGFECQNEFSRQKLLCRKYRKRKIINDE